MSQELNLPMRPRRNRKSASIRRLCRETLLTTDDLIYPLFLHDRDEDEPIASMPGCNRWSLEGLCREIEEASSLGIPAFVLFPAIEENLKTPRAEECYNEEGLLPRALQKIKKTFPEATLITDVALDPYNSDGHDGIVAENGEILNDATVEILCQQALCQAHAGADILAPSDMMDGRIGAIREALDRAGSENISLLAYTAKYASAFYGPFRGALNSAPQCGDKQTYQMDYANAREALREAELDLLEGADMLMVKPAGPYLDIIQLLRTETTLPLAAYHVSGEYLMIKAASEKGWLEEKALVLETLTGIKRAGADMVLTYYAKQAAQWLKEK